MDVSSILGREPAMYIDGSWVTTDETRPVINPTDESAIAEVPEAEADHAEQALEAAQRAQRDWGRKSGVVAFFGGEKLIPWAGYAYLLLFPLLMGNGRLVNRRRKKNEAAMNPKE